jgi:hypothetical protein
MPALVCISCGNAATMFHQVRAMTRGLRPFEVATDFLLTTHRFIAVCKYVLLLRTQCLVFTPPPRACSKFPSKQSLRAGCPQPCTLLSDSCEAVTYCGWGMNLPWCFRNECVFRLLVYARLENGCKYPFFQPKDSAVYFTHLAKISGMELHGWYDVLQ